MLTDCLTVIDLDGTVSVCRLDAHVELGHRAGDVIPDGADGHWHVEDVVLDARCLTVRVVEVKAPIALRHRVAAPVSRRAA